MNIKMLINNINDALKLRDEIFKAMENTRNEIKQYFIDQDGEVSFFRNILDIEVLLSKQNILNRHFEEIVQLYPEIKISQDGYSSNDFLLNIVENNLKNVEELELRQN